jgi:perosamine synthetase
MAAPNLGEEEVDAVREVFLSGTLTDGPVTASFEEDFARYQCVEHAVAMTSGTAALFALYRAMGVGPGDEVIVPSLTFISSATTILLARAHPVFADVDPETFNLDPHDVSRRVTAKTKGIVAVHYGGQPADLDELRAVADDAGVWLIEDAAEAHGALYKGQPVGGCGEAAIFSFTPTKNITTGEGGIVTTNNGDLATALRMERNHGQAQRYLHVSLGFNWRMTEMQAAIGRVQLRKLESILATKETNAKWFRDRLGATTGLILPIAKPDRRHVYMLFSILVDRGRDAVLAELADASIESRVYFPPAHQQPIFEGYRHPLPVTEDLANRMLSIPFHARLTSEDLEEIAGILARAVASQ